jgi:hypothetical protein
MLEAETSNVMDIAGREGFSSIGIVARVQLYLLLKAKPDTKPQGPPERKREKTIPNDKKR